MSPTASTKSRDSVEPGALQAGLDLIDQGFSLIDQDLRLIAWNSAFLTLLDFPPEMAYVGAPFEAFIRHNAERGEYGAGNIEEQVRVRIDSARAFKTHEIERIRPNGNVLKIRGVPLPGRGFVTLYSDVTRQRDSERLILEQNALLESRVSERTNELQGVNSQLREALRLNEAFAESLERSSSQLRLITDSIPALLAYFNSSLVYEYINRGYRDWFGLDPSQPKSVSAREFLGQDTYSRIKPFIKRALAGEPVTFEYEVMTQGGAQKLARTTLIPEVTSAANVVGCFELTFDITQERRAQEVIAQVQKMEALGQLTSGLSHDFNNILTVILGNLVALSAQGDVRHHVEEYIQPAIDAAYKGSELIKGLLAFSRQQPVHSCSVDIDDCIKGLDKLVRHTLPSTLTLCLDLDAAEARCLVDSNQLQNALLNLILNAKDATESKGRIEVCSTVTRLCAVDAHEMNLPIGEYVCVNVEDDGCGIDAQTLSRVFEPFFTTKQAGHGTGLGLSMVYGFARQSGGMVKIASDPGVGTTVSLWLPLSQEKGSAESLGDVMHENLPVPEQAHNGLALLVEDDDGVRKVVRRHLLDLGFAVIEASSGQEAIEILDQSTKLDVLLSDFVMPGQIDGYQVTKRAVQRGDIPRVLLMSGYTPDVIPTPEVLLLQKPFSKEQLFEALQMCSA